MNAPIETRQGYEIARLESFLQEAQAKLEKAREALMWAKPRLLVETYFEAFNNPVIEALALLQSSNVIASIKAEALREDACRAVESLRIAYDVRLVVPGDDYYKHAIEAIRRMADELQEKQG